MFVSLDGAQYWPYEIQKDVWKNCSMQKKIWINSKFWNGKYNWERWSRTGKTLCVKTVCDSRSNSEHEVTDAWTEAILDSIFFFYWKNKSLNGAKKSLQ